MSISNMAVIGRIRYLAGIYEISPHMNDNNVVAVVVTYNRLPLLKKCITALLMQTLAPAKISIINNASIGDTAAWLDALADEHPNRITVTHLTENTGGAGGFSRGLRHATATGVDWTWMMDDDAEPHPTALAELMKIATNPANVYGSVAIRGEETSWTTTLLQPEECVVNRAAEVPDEAQVQSLPFLGFLIHADLVRTIGLPDKGFFIAADDVEYCVRAKRAGAKIIIAGRSHIEHPKTNVRTWQFLGKRIAYLSLAPWKRYYDTRNRLLIARKYYGFKTADTDHPWLLYATVCGFVLRTTKISSVLGLLYGHVRWTSRNQGPATCQMGYTPVS